MRPSDASTMHLMLMPCVQSSPGVSNVKLSPSQRFESSSYATHVHVHFVTYVGLFFSAWLASAAPITAAAVSSAVVTPFRIALIGLPSLRF